MRLSRPSLPLTTDGAWVCLLFNQVATPGLGTIWGGRRATGWSQLTLAAAGFCLLMFWMWRNLFVNAIREQMGDPLLPTAQIVGDWGALLFGLAWLWAWFSSVGMVREAKRRGARSRPPKLSPPRLACPPDGPYADPGLGRAEDRSRREPGEESPNTTGRDAA